MLVVLIPGIGEVVVLVGANFAVEYMQFSCDRLEYVGDITLVL